jgi:hypothetical protein
MTPIEGVVPSVGQAVPWCFPLRICTGIPVGAHPGAFGTSRKHDIHTGVDLYCRDGDPASAVEDGVIVRVDPFTGPTAGSPWWQDTQAVLVEGASGVVTYGEITPLAGMAVGRRIRAGEDLGWVTEVLKEGKERPDIPGHRRAMLHVELYRPGTREPVTWPLHCPCPVNLLDPTPHLLHSANRPGNVLSACPPRQPD